MARNFNGTSDIAINATFDLTGQADFVVAGWLYRADNTQTNRQVFEYGNGTQAGFDVSANTTLVAGSDLIRTYTATLQWSDTYVSPAAGAWHHYVWYLPGNGVGAPQPNAVWIDGAAVTLTTQTHSGVGNVTSNALSHMGRTSGGVSSQFLGGRIAEFAMWSGLPKLTQHQITALANGVPPPVIYPDRIIHYVPYLGDANPEPDAHGGVHHPMTLTGTTAINHPRVRSLLACR